MVSASQKRKSLFDFPGSAGATGFGRMGTYTAASTCARTSAVTGGYNQELNSFLCDMRATQAADAARYGDKLFTPNSAARQRGVELAWRYEKKSILMGGKGSENWTAAERREIVDTGSLRGSQGHHQRNVALHPEDQANPHNIKFYRSQREHLQNGHKGSWSNESDAPMINRDKMLTRTNARRVFRNEVRGIGLTAAIGLGIGFSIGFAATLAQSGISVGTIQDALKGGLQGGLTAAGLSVTGYALSRTLGQVASCAVVGALENAGVAVTTQLAQAVSAGVMGGLTIAVFAVYQFATLKRQGMGTKLALTNTAKQALVSVAILVVGIAIQCIAGNKAAAAVTIGLGLATASSALIKTVKGRKLADRIRECAIDGARPVFA